MKKKIFFVILLLSLVNANVSAQTIPAALTGKALKPHKTVNKTEFERQYSLYKDYWDKAFTFLKNNNLDTMATGRYAIDGDNVLAFITENPTKYPDSAKWESHRNYIDLHLVITGEEKIGVADVSKLTVTMPYDASKDLANYSGDGKTYIAKPDTFFLFFPSDAHRPNITTGDNKADKKIVIKIRYAE